MIGVKDATGVVHKGHVYWWEPEPVFKMHYVVTLEDERVLGIFKNMKTGGWYYADAA